MLRVQTSELAWAHDGTNYLRSRLSTFTCVVVIVDLDHGQFKAKLVTHVVDGVNLLLNHLVCAVKDNGRVILCPRERRYVLNGSALYVEKDCLEAIDERAHVDECDQAEGHVPEQRALVVVPLAARDIVRR